MSRKVTVFMPLKASPQWLALPRDDREAFHDGVLARVFEGFPGVRLRWFDAQAFHGRCCGVAMWEADTLADYHELAEALRETPFFAPPYFEVLDVIVSAEDGWREPAPPLPAVLAW